MHSPIYRQSVRTAIMTISSFPDPQLRRDAIQPNHLDPCSIETWPLAAWFTCVFVGNPRCTTTARTTARYQTFGAFSSAASLVATQPRDSSCNVGDAGQDVIYDAACHASFTPGPHLSLYDISSSNPAAYCAACRPKCLCLHIVNSHSLWSQ
ncbi:uncharacterized protein BCR38DRAFT_213180 [Pseudomassariella vexata]|uniref:Uncharacterized protein n=1 Tax=Pseudomassariella vexata TaxID=1141098 RepID=A0A1Y2DYJ6_9PEZI|nr:uncharacterized protein BCR38DRAFT_213180 [Pseudomassariella vexata]ORY64380.1 hypothetical protein BCR38DRAFT_213180 [Pseudomassariella vexata]